VSVHAFTREDGSRAYKVRWREQDRNRGRTFALKRDAEAFDRDIERRRQLGPLAVQQLTGRGGPTLGEWISEHWAPEHAATLAPATRDRYANVYEVHLAPWLDGVPLGEISVARLRGWQAERMKAGVKPGTIHKCRTLLSSVLRHAAESDAIPANPISLVRAPRADQRDAVKPLAPVTVEKIRHALLNPARRTVSGSEDDRRRRRGYDLPALGTPQTRLRDVTIVSLLAYAGLRPGELRALRFGDIREHTLLIQRAANPDGSAKPTKNHQNRTVKLLPALEQDLREYRLAAGRPSDKRLLLAHDDGRPWDKTAWQIWRTDRWRPACGAVGMEKPPRPYDLRHSFASLLLAERRQPAYVARQLGHTTAVLWRTYEHLMDEYEMATSLDANAEILKARSSGSARAAI
jgi:integrase